MTQQIENRSVQQQATFEETPRSSLVIMLASVADDLEPWGFNVYNRDRQLRSFWPTEPILASAVYNITIRNAAFSWRLEGPPRTVAATQRLLHEADLGRGWLNFMTKFCQDRFTQDNGSFIEIIRAGETAESPVVGIANLDAGRCRRTGVPETPVIYTDRRGAIHKLNSWQVIATSEFPSPIETMNGVGLCAVSRVLRAAQLLRDISVYRREKVSGRNPDAIHLVSGIRRQEIEDALGGHQTHQEQQGFSRWFKPAILTTLDPNATVDVKTLNLKSLPEGFDEEQVMRWYINQLALGFGADYQDFAPLPGRGLGTSTQSMVLHEKSRGKGPGYFMKTIEHLFNFHGIIPRNVTFIYDEEDFAHDLEQAAVEKSKAETRKIYAVDIAAIDAVNVRQQMLDDGTLSKEEFVRLQEAEDATPEVTAVDDERLQPTDVKQVINEGISDFDEEERRDFEIQMADDIATSLARFFRLLRGRILAAKARFGRKQENIENLATDPELWTDFRTTMVGTMSPYSRNVALAAVMHNLDIGIGVDLDRVNPQVLDFSRIYTSEWYTRLEETTRASLQKAIQAWQESGLGTQGLPDLVDAIEPLFGRARAERIAATEVTRIFDEGNLLAHLDAGIETEEWQTVRDEVVCIICSPLDGKRFPTNAGPRPVTDTHINCRCARVPVVDDVALEE